jgi:phosphoglycerate dehydrogenase-like enzyme
MSKPVVLVAPYPRTVSEIFREEDLERLAGFSEVLWARDGVPPAAYVEQVLPRLWSFVAPEPQLDERRLEAALRLRSAIEVGGHFPASIDYAGCFARGIRVLSCAPAFGPSVAELALAMTLGACRGLVAAHVDFAAGREVWQGDRPTDFTLFGETVGFIGFGALARNLLPLIRPFGCKVLAYDPWLPTSLIAGSGCTPTALDELLSASRVVYVLAAPAPENKALLDAGKIALMQKGALLVLISRSHLVDFDAVTSAVQSGRIQAAIDVFPQEPFPLDAAIRQAPNVILSAHRGASLRKERRTIGRMVVDDLELMSKGLPPVLLQVAQPEIISRRVAIAGTEYGEGAPQAAP